MRLLDFLCAPHGGADIVVRQRCELRRYQGALFLRQVGEYVIGLDKLILPRVFVTFLNSVVCGLLIALSIDLSGSVVRGCLDILAIGPDGRRFAKLQDCFIPALTSCQFLSVFVVVLERCIEHGIQAGYFGGERDIRTQRVDGLVIMRLCHQHLRVHDSRIQFPLFTSNLALETKQRSIVWPDFQQAVYVQLSSRQLRIPRRVVLQGFSVRLEVCLIRSREVIQFPPYPVP